MIIVAGTMSLDPSVIADFQREVAAMLARVKTEKGCRHYSLLVEDASAGLVNALERWDDEVALIEHLAQPWIVAFFNRFSPHLRSHTMQVYDIAAPPGRSRGFSRSQR